MRLIGAYHLEHPCYGIRRIKANWRMSMDRRWLANGFVR